MVKPWESDNCEQLRSHFAYYAVPVAAMLWCGVPPEDLESELRNTSEHPSIRGVQSHPYIKCLEPRCRVIHDAIDSGALPCSRENGKTVGPNDRVAVERRHVSRDDLKAWIARQFPADKPAFLFDEVERSTHTAINAESFRALQADRDSLKARIEKATEVLRSLKQEKDTLENERDSLRAIVEKMNTPSDRAETTYLNIIGGLLGLLLGRTPADKPQSVFSSQAAIISALLAHYGGKPGISDTTLEGKFAEAKRTLRSA
jgi:hypothetical protein